MNAITRLALFPKTRDEWLQLRKADITSTEVSALFNASKYMTAYELALVKNGEIEDQFRENERSMWGNRFEADIAKGVSDFYGVRIRKKKEYMRIPEARMGASFDFEITGLKRGWKGSQYGSDVLRDMYASHGNGLLEIKNVDSLIFRNEWNVGEEPEAPPHIEIQLQQQAFVSGLTWGVIGVMIGGNDLRLIPRFADSAVALKLFSRVAKFWQDLSQGVYPPPTYPDDNWVICKLHSFADPGKLMDATGDKAPAGMLQLIERYQQCARLAKRIEDQQKTAQSKLLQLIGSHEKVLTDIATISCKSVPGGHIEYDRKPYRGWKITPKQTAKAAKEE